MSGGASVLHSHSGGGGVDRRVLSPFSHPSSPFSHPLFPFSRPCSSPYSQQPSPFSSPTPSLLSPIPSLLSPTSSLLSPTPTSPLLPQPCPPLHSCKNIRLCESSQEELCLCVCVLCFLFFFATSPVSL